MIDNIAYAMKLTFFAFGAWHLYKHKLSGVMLLVVPFFMTGVELISTSEYAWAYLFSESVTNTDYKKALFGGALMLMMPVLLIVLCGKDIASLIDVDESQNTRNEK